ncbi:hypothetical protein PSACC_03156 [Paramicrosporidium saccamoebae]|uniref:Uncharacterized protein n=1 Tax=Paramicrosporidium saccamoebae TaxID=1246581 RepID=A0A2H9TH00_9FUNG|nr:hypothetical protein PSACC_03156 [Paramicrosporidium saccamoebae]
MSVEAQSALRRIQGELVLLEKQQAHFATVLCEFQNYVSLLLSVRSGALIRNECNLLDVENKAAALQFRAHTASCDMTLTIGSLDKLLNRVYSATGDTGLRALLTREREVLQHRRTLCERDFELAGPNLETLTTTIALLRNPRPPDLGPLYDAFGVPSINP